VGIFNGYISDDDPHQRHNVSDSDSKSNPDEVEAMDEIVDDLPENVSEYDASDNVTENGEYDYDYDASENGTEICEYDYDYLLEEKKASPDKGAGSGNNFVASLRRGDRIGLWARLTVGILTSYITISYIFHLGKLSERRISASRRILLDSLLDKSTYLPNLYELL
jgi:hypothetical protein